MEEKEKDGAQRAFGAGTRIRRRDIKEAAEPLAKAMEDEDDAIRCIYLAGALAGLCFQHIDEDAETFGDGLVEYLENSWANLATEAVLRSMRDEVEWHASKVVKIVVTRKENPDGR